MAKKFSKQVPLGGGQEASQATFYKQWLGSSRGSSPKAVAEDFSNKLPNTTFKKLLKKLLKGDDAEDSRTCSH